MLEKHHCILQKIPINSNDDYSSKLCCGKAMVAYAKPQQGKKEEVEGLREERDQSKFICIVKFLQTI